MKTHFFALISLVLTAILSTASAFAQQAIVDVFDTTVLQKLDQPNEYSLATTLGLGQKEADFLKQNISAPDLAKLKVLRLKEFQQSGNGLYATIAQTIKSDVSEIIKQSGEKMAYSSENAEVIVPGGNVARHFDWNWLSSKFSGLPLVAVVNRLDKKDFYPGTCGEVRFIYRLAYYRSETKGDSRSTLPLFLNVVYDYLPGFTGECGDVAKAWIVPQNVLEAYRAGDSGIYLNWLKSSALNKAKMRIKQIELNMQAVRYPSGQKTDFGGQAIYLFRIFEFQNNALVSIPLENTPDVSAILKSPALKASLIAQLTDKDNSKKIDEGTFVLENTNGQLLAKRALSFSTNGRGRLPNKPFTAIFGAEAKDLAAVDLSAFSFIRTKQGLVERLNNNTCTGCHQTGGTAGFHILGRPGSLNSPFNKVILPFSPHFSAERERRKDYVNKVAAQQAPAQFRPLSFFTSANWLKIDSVSKAPEFEKAKVRDLCLNSNQDFSSTVSCQAGLTCKSTVVNSALGVTIGECVRSPNIVPGHVCRVGVVQNSKLNLELGDLFNLRSGADKIDISKVFTDQGQFCGNPSGGVPLGRISLACDSNTAEGRLEFVDRLDKEPMPSAICAMRGGPQFDECAKSKNPPDCLAKTKIARGLLDTCSLTNFCREDYICQQLPTEISRLYAGNEKAVVEARIHKLAQFGIGFCVPNYFVFNMRTDGHIIPERDVQ